MTDVTAPYTFVPLARHVCQACELGLTVPPSQDMPADGALGGTIDVTLTCDTPVLVNWGPERDQGVKAFGRTPDDIPAIPGSTLRGMVRGVLEIAGFGKMALADDARTSVRDLTPAARLDYGERVTTGDKNSGYAPKSRAGWLAIKEGGLQIVPCDFGRIDHADLSKLSSTFQRRVQDCLREFKNKASHPPAWKDMAKAEYVERQFLSNCEKLDHRLWVQERETVHQHSQPLRYRRVATTQAEAERTDGIPARQIDGTLVFTGMPSDRKHMEFFFFDPAPHRAVRVPEEVWRGFLDVHEWQEKISDTWKWRKAALGRGEAIPVFYLTGDNGEITHLGLAMMFKLPADISIGQMIENSSPDHRDPHAVDLPEAIFGRLESGKGKGDGWRGRVSFGWALAEAGTWREDETPTPAILARPKPGYAPAYVRQRDFQSGTGTVLLTVGTKTDREGRTTDIKANYRSYMAWGPSGQAPVKEEIRGWKRYPVRGQPHVPPPTVEGDSVSRLRPLRPAPGGRPITFTFRLRYHNLHPVELGALLWAALWGGDEGLRHAVGMGRPFGWGRARVAAALDAAQRAAMAQFAEKMEAWARQQGLAGGWADSVQLRQLKAMADPDKGAIEQDAGRLASMTLIVGQPNPFTDAKKAGTVLPEYAGMAATEVADPIDEDSIKTDFSRALGPQTQTAIRTFNNALRARRGRGAAHAAPAAAGDDRFPVGSRWRCDGHGLVEIVRWLAPDRRWVRKADRPDDAGRAVSIRALRPL